DEGRELVEAAVRISPINPLARLARAQLTSKSSESTSRALDLGLSRDAVSLAWSAGRSATLEKRNPQFESTGRLYRSPAIMTSHRPRSPHSTTSPTFAAISCPVKRPLGQLSKN